MRTLILVFALIASACVHPQAPAAPKLAPENQAVTYATKKVTPDAACLPLSTAQSGRADSAFCDLGRVLAYCTSGLGADGLCVALADMRPKAPEAPKTEPKPAEQPAPPVPAAPPQQDAKPSTPSTPINMRRSGKR
ncbi:MAG TPA: hypothetical protein VMZ53_03890 [Kofleriaceae bacterium]|nr:hypothetical protein [Kofleriaceae bacterium]